MNEDEPPPEFAQDPALEQAWHEGVEAASELFQHSVNNSLQVLSGHLDLLASKEKFEVEETRHRIMVMQGAMDEIIGIIRSLRSIDQTGKTEAIEGKWVLSKRMDRSES